MLETAGVGNGEGVGARGELQVAVGAGLKP